MTATHQFPSEPESVTAARHYVGQALTGCPSHLVDAAQLMVSELATNSIRHARTGFTLTIEQTRHRVLIEVSDTGPGNPAVRSPAVTEPTGRGLRIVQIFSDDWGVRSNPGQPGKTVWFSLNIPPVARRAVGGDISSD
jgi:anti-sigma regulatory factor (Ser/Thr protein kinase)